MGAKSSAPDKLDNLEDVVSTLSDTVNKLNVAELLAVFQHLDSAHPDWASRLGSDSRRWNLYKQIWVRGWHVGLIALRNKIAPTTDALYLGVIPRPWHTAFAVVHEPLASSGDVYHIAAYIILSRALGYTIPKIKPSIEEGRIDPVTVEAAERSRAFLHAIGMGATLVDPVSIAALPSSRSASRRKALREKLQGTDYIDQRALTTIIADYFIQAGVDTATSVIAQKLRENLEALRNNATLPAELQMMLRPEKGSIFASVTAAAPKHPIVILHLRHSTHANKEANFSELQVNVLLQEALAIPSSRVLIMHVSDKKQDIRALSKLPRDIRDRVFVVQPFAEAKVEVPVDADVTSWPRCFSSASHVDPGKLVHLAWLLALQGLYASKSCDLVIVGNTSGTLDLAAFIGLPVINYHQPRAADADRDTRYQDYRVMMQQAFARVRNTSSLASKLIIKELLDQLARPDRAVAFFEPISFIPAMEGYPAMLQLAGNKKISGRPSLLKSMALLSCVFVADAKDVARSEDLCYINDKPIIAALILPSARRVHAVLQGDSTLYRHLDRSRILDIEKAVKIAECDSDLFSSITLGMLRDVGDPMELDRRLHLLLGDAVPDIAEWRHFFQSWTGSPDDNARLAECAVLSRVTIAGHMRLHEEKYFPLFMAERAATGAQIPEMHEWHAYLDDLAKSASQWGGGLEIHAAQELVGVGVTTVVRSTGPAFIAAYPLPQLKPGPSIVFVNGNHYRLRRDLRSTAQGAPL